MEPVLSLPIQTKAGLVDPGSHNAFSEGSLLTWTNNNELSKMTTTGFPWNCVATLSGGPRAQVVGFDIDFIQSNTLYADSDDISNIISPREYLDLTYLASLCSRNQLNVVPPSALPSASPSVLTLDRTGSLAVYIGRAACAVAGKDFLLFRPTSTEEEEGVDISILMQLLGPILAEQTADGTAIFEAYADQHHKMVAPDEILMFCVDISSSMAAYCDFLDVQQNEGANLVFPRTNNSQTRLNSNEVSDHPALCLSASDDLKEYLSAHELFGDRLAIVRSGKDDY